MTDVEEKDLRIDALTLNPHLQFRATLNPQQVERLAGAYDSGAEVPPIEVALVNGVPMVVDGWHRVAAAKRLGWRSIPGKVTTMTWEEALLAAALANLGHGLRLKASEEKKAQRTALSLYLRMKRHLSGKGKVKSFREIGADLGGIPHTTVRNWIIKNHPQVARKHWGLEGTPGGGGAREALPKMDLEDLVEGHLKNALAIAGGISDPVARGGIIGRLRAALTELEAGGAWKIEEEADF